MILYFWTYTDNKIIHKTGFNLSSKYDFEFTLTSSESHLPTNKTPIQGELTVKKIDTPILFNEQIKDVKVIVGKNGSGKSSIINELNRVLFRNKDWYDVSENPFFIVVSDFVGYEEQIDVIHSSGIIIDCTQNIRNYILIENFNNSIVHQHIKNTLFVRYSPLLTINNVGDYGYDLGSLPEVYGSSLEYYDISTENQMVRDTKEYSTSLKSDLLSHKNAEGWRILEFILTDGESILKEFNFKNEIPDITFNIESSGIERIEEIQEFATGDRNKNSWFNIPFRDKAKLEKIVGEEGRIYRDKITIQFTSFSGGEMTILSLFSRLNNLVLMFPKIYSSVTDIFLILDEPDLTLHPEWQKALINILNKQLPLLFKNISFQLLITSHSPILLSDLPNEHILFLEKENGQCRVVNVQERTFGANIHSLYAHAFFLSNGKAAMGDFAKEQIKNLIEEIKNPDSKEEEIIRKKIELIGEPLIRNQLKTMMENRDKASNKINSLEEQVKMLKDEVENLKKQIGQ
jgi:polyhydroxyalkanoate synthesis regulator phasin/predicted ATPase